MYTPEELDIARKIKEEGGSMSDARQAIAKYRSSKPAQTSTPSPSSTTVGQKASSFTKAIGLGGATDVFGRLINLKVPGLIGQNEGQRRVSELTGMSQAEINRANIEAPTRSEVAGAAIQTASIPAGMVVTGGTSLAGQMAAGAALGYLYDVGSDLAEGKAVSESLAPGGATAIGLLTPPAIRAVTGAIGAVRGVPSVLSTGQKVAEAVPTPSAPSGLKQIGTETLERIPRAFEKGQTMLDEAAIRAERLRTAPPVVQQAIKSGLDDVVVTAVEQADEPTKQAFKEMVEIAETPRTSLRPNVKPSSVAGNAVSEQYDILNKTRQSVGQQIGDAVDALSSKGATIDVLPQQRQIRDLLRQNGIMPDASGKLKFDGSSLTPKQQTLVQQLYELSTQSDTLTPRQVYNYDKLFSQLQREARFDNLDNVYLSTPEGDVNVYRAFRNIFANKLDEVAPEIAPLNREYAQLRNLQDDIESSIVKRGNFESTRNVDAAEFAQTNLRRIFSDAQSAADYRALADKLDALARAKGYAGANPQDLAGFAERLRSIYPETTPETSFKGSITTSIKDVAGKVLDVGKPDVTDQQKALRALLGIEEVVPTVPTKSDVSDFIEVKPKTKLDQPNLQGGYIANPLVKGSRGGSSANGNKIKPTGLDRLEEYTAWVNGEKEVTGEALVALKADAQMIADGMKMGKTTGGDKQLANTITKWLDKYNTDKAFRDSVSFKSGATPKTTALLEEAKKYDNPTDFINAQKDNFAFHGTPFAEEIAKSEIRPSKSGNLGEGLYLSRDKNTAREFTKLQGGGKGSNYEDSGNGLYTEVSTGEQIQTTPGVFPYYIGDLNLKKLSDGIEQSPDFAKQAMKEGYDGVDASNSVQEPQVVVFPDAIKKMRGLQDMKKIWEQSQ